MPRTARGGDGWIYQTLVFPFALPLVATAETKYSKALGYQFDVVSADFVTDVVGTGASATRTVQIKKGSTIIGSVALTLASQDTIGEITAVSMAVMTQDTARFADADVLAIDFPASGTAFTAGRGSLRILVRTRAQQR